MAKRRAVPNAEKPLDEPTVGRRIWAAFLSKRMRQAEFHRALAKRIERISPATVDNWLIDKYLPELKTFAEIAEIVGFSMEELYYGRMQLSDEQLRELLTRLRATPEERIAFTEHVQRGLGRHQNITAAYVAGYFASLREDVSRLPPESAATTEQRATTAAMAAEDASAARAKGFKQVRAKESPKDPTTTEPTDPSEPTEPQDPKGRRRGPHRSG
jgi:hypothetical protein